MPPDPTGSTKTGSCSPRAIGRPLRAADVSHAFCDGWATLGLASGAPLKVVSDNLGASSISVTDALSGSIMPGLDRDLADAAGRALSHA